MLDCDPRERVHNNGRVSKERSDATIPRTAAFSIGHGVSRVWEICHEDGERMQTFATEIRNTGYENPELAVLLIRREPNREEVNRLDRSGVNTRVSVTRWCHFRIIIQRIASCLHLTLALPKPHRGSSLSRTFYRGAKFSILRSTKVNAKHRKESLRASTFSWTFCNEHGFLATYESISRLISLGSRRNGEKRFDRVRGAKYEIVRKDSSETDNGSGRVAEIRFSRGENETEGGGVANGRESRSNSILSGIDRQVVDVYVFCFAGLDSGAREWKISTYLEDRISKKESRYLPESHANDIIEPLRRLDRDRFSFRRWIIPGVVGRIFRSVTGFRVSRTEDSWLAIGRYSKTVDITARRGSAMLVLVQTYGTHDDCQSRLFRSRT